MLETGCPLRAIKHLALLDVGTSPCVTPGSPHLSLPFWSSFLSQVTAEAGRRVRGVRIQGLELWQPVLQMGRNSGLS